MKHQGRLNEIAAQHGLPPLHGGMETPTYLGYAMDLVLVGLGLLKAAEVDKKNDRHHDT